MSHHPEIHDQNLRSRALSFYICEACRFVDDDRERMKVGYNCPRCLVPGKGGMIYFRMNVFTLIDLVERFYYTESKSVPMTQIPGGYDKSGLKLAVVIFFCTLAEVLLEHFLQHCMHKMGVPHQVQQRLLDDNPFVKQRVDKIFPTLTGVKWDRAVKLQNQSTALDYSGTVEFHKRVTRARNEFLHRGDRYVITQKMSEECMHHIWPLVSLFVDLHNQYAAQSVKRRTTEDRENNMHA